ncbi:hypothetical protein DPX16_16080 [Anabarilius grahami]|uniref:Uncharacterized protein n=1 Tax=Anabarilius grahami TaxID=495550 RepID=A0A3N0YPN0_ANAGA|nr:hypothetical protein DPX16_16080 [Anabarilius grahami]
MELIQSSANENFEIDIQESAPPLCQSQSEPEPGANSETTPSVVIDLTDFTNQDLSGNTEDTADSTVVLQQWRSLRQEQDKEFEQSLMADREKILFDFVGQDDLSSEVFYVQDATSSTPLENNLSGTLNDNNIQGHSTLYVVWVSPMDEIKEADSVEKANSAISDAGDCLNMLGALRFISSLEERDCLVQSAADYFVNGRTNLALRQFEEGFKTFCLLDELKKNAGIFEDLFINGVRPLEAKDLSTLFEVDFSPMGSNKRRLENKTICFWRDWLIDVEVQVEKQEGGRERGEGVDGCVVSRSERVWGVRPGLSNLL